MVTRREIVIACVASFATLAVAWAQTKDQPKQIIKSAVFDVENLPSKAGKFGSQKQLFNGKTTMLDSFECHTSTVNAGQEVHGPQPQFDEELIIVREGT